MPMANPSPSNLQANAGPGDSDFPGKRPDEAPPGKGDTVNPQVPDEVDPGKGGDFDQPEPGVPEEQPSPLETPPPPD